MRLNIKVKLNNPKLTIFYRECILSLFKAALSDYEDGTCFEHFYKDTKEKNFTFAVSLPKGKFSRDAIELESNEFVLIVSGDNRDMMVLYNALLLMIGKEHKIPFDNAITIEKICNVEPKKINEDAVVCKTMMPLLVRDHQPDNKDRYLKPGDEDFLHILKRNIAARYHIDSNLMNGFDIQFITSKPTMTKFKKALFPGTMGIFKMTGNPVLLNILYTEGMGSKRSAGFGFFEIV